MRHASRDFVRGTSVIFTVDDITHQVIDVDIVSRNRILRCWLRTAEDYTITSGRNRTETFNTLDALLIAEEVVRTRTDSTEKRYYGFPFRIQF